MAKFKKFKKETVREQKRARWKFVHNIVNTTLEDNNTRPFWKYVNAQRQDNFGIAYHLSSRTANSMQIATSKPISC